MPRPIRRLIRTTVVICMTTTTLYYYNTPAGVVCPATRRGELIFARRKRRRSRNRKPRRQGAEPAAVARATKPKTRSAQAYIITQGRTSLCYCYYVRAHARISPSDFPFYAAAAAAGITTTRHCCANVFTRFRSRPQCCPLDS